MTDSESKDRYLARLGEAFITTLLETPDVDLKALHHLFGGGDQIFLSNLKAAGDEYAFAVEVIGAAGMNEAAFRDLARCFIGKRLASLMGAKEVVVTW